MILAGLMASNHTFVNKGENFSLLMVTSGFVAENHGIRQSSDVSMARKLCNPEAVSPVFYGEVDKT